MTPADLVLELGIEPKALRAWLRVTYPRSRLEEGQAWALTSEMAAQARARFGPGADSAPPPEQAAGLARDLEEDVDRFRSARLFERSAVLAKPCPVPAAPGIYGWWFR